MFSIRVRILAPPKADANTVALCLHSNNAEAYSLERSAPSFKRTRSSQDNSRSARNAFRNNQENGLNQCTATTKKAITLHRLSSPRMCAFSCCMTSSISLSSYDEGKTNGLIVDYIGIFDNVAKARNFDEAGMKKVITNIEEVKKQVPALMRKCLSYFMGVDRTVEGWEGLLAAQECLPNNKTKDEFAADYCNLLQEAEKQECKVREEMSKKALELTERYRDFKAAGTKGITSCSVRSVILPLLADHVLREANHYLRLLEIMKNI